MVHRNPYPSTVAVRTGIDEDSRHGAVVPPLYLTSTFSFAGLGQKRDYDYTRSGNPTRHHLSTALARLESGSGCVVTATGMAAAVLALQLLSPRDLLIAPHDCYGGCWRLFDAWHRQGRFRLRFVDFTDPEAVAAALQDGPRMVWLESPSNPLLRITDIGLLCRMAHEAGALVVADNTFLSPFLQRPLELGCDLVVHSTTKYLNGHSDVVGGAVVCRDESLHEELAWWANCLGVTGSPFDSYQTLRGLRTLTPRMEAHERNARAIAETLSSHDTVSRVHYPGLASHPGHEVASRQQFGFGAMVSFELHGGEAAVRAFLEGLSCFSLAESLGGVESLIAHPATMTHASMSDAARVDAGIGDSLLRLSVGIEDGRDLEADIRAGLERAATVSRRGRTRPASVAASS